MSSKSSKLLHLDPLAIALEKKRERESLNANPEEAKNPTPVTPVTPVTDVTIVTGVTPVTGDAAPKRDFTRVANSVVRDAIPAGLFTGKGKQLYDYLYSQTRGAIVPVRSARIPTEKVMKGAGMTRHTYRAHLQRLISAGLIHLEEKAGEHGGNLFTVYLPEEIGVKRGDRGHRGHKGDKGHRSETGQNLPVVQGSKLDRGDIGLSNDFANTYITPKTSLKTNTNDDDAYSELNEILRTVTKELTGKASQATDKAKWAEVGRVLAEELKEAATRAESISSVPAFLAEHLRRRLSRPERRTREGNRSKQTTSSPEATTAPPPADRRLTPEEITEQASIIREVIEGGYTMEQAEAQFKGSFHPDDWQQIKERVEK